MKAELTIETSEGVVFTLKVEYEDGAVYLPNGEMLFHVEDADED